MDSAILWLLGAAGVLSIALFVLKGLLDQLPDLAQSWHRARHAFSNDGRPGSGGDGT
ncbi:hypothetical protein MUU72_29615 [Streptomyces sp. RS10V-4]|uniref:hypothetical protein n=1 Tax=Streptomyces rhizoryzae TaxID=2932493 RepID=UPI0020062749|nr:hypothetical protein [Streptomyces rhizoryzae]MCK7627204.1 hypothetical protein [Streptomyces rhizoryzae]